MRVGPNSLALALLLLTLQSVAAQTLEDALIEAYLHNPDLSAEQAALRAKDTRVPQARAGYYPNLTATLQRQYTRGDGRSAFVFPDEPGVDLSPYEEILETQDADSTIATLALKQNLYAGGGTSAALAKAEKQVRAGRANLTSVEQTVLLNAANAYVDVWRDRGLMAEAQLNLERLSDRLTATRRRLELGEVAQTDLAQAEAARARGQADRDQASANLASSEATYERVIGMPKALLGEPHAILELPRSLEDPTGGRCEPRRRAGDHGSVGGALGCGHRLRQSVAQHRPGRPAELLGRPESRPICTKRVRRSGSR